MNPFSASKLHPATWWFLGLCLAAAASLANSILTLALVLGFAISAMLLLREDAPWSRSIRFYLALGAFVVAMRVLFRIVFNSSDPADPVAFSLIAINLAGIDFLGVVTWVTLETALTDGLRLATIIISIGMANTLANPKRLLKSTPGALYELATAMTVAINLAPQLIESLQRVRRARALRGRSKGISQLSSIVIPVLEDTIDQSLALAASMDSRGFGRRGQLTRAQVLLGRVLSLGGLLLILIATYFLLATNATTIAVSLIATGVVALFFTIRVASRRNLRTRFRKQKPRARDLIVALVGIAWIVSVVLI